MIGAGQEIRDQGLRQEDATLGKQGSDPSESIGSLLELKAN